MKNSNYKNTVHRKFLFIFALIIICIISLLVDITTGPISVSFSEAVNVLLNPNSDEGLWVILVDMRIPIALMAIVVGASLGLSGAVMQTILNNPLASPYTLGIGAGAAFGAALSIVFKSDFVSDYLNFFMPICAFFFAMLACMVIYLLGNNKQMSTAVMILAGIAMLFIFQSLLALVQYGASEDEVQAIVFWTFGSLQKVDWIKLAIAFTILVIGFIIIMKNSWKLTALLMGEEKAQSLGVNIKRVKIQSFILISLLSATAVCFVGTIGFIGLVSPHFARMLVFDEQRFYLPFSALFGAFLLSSASILSKIVIPGIIFPIGIITSLIGASFFFIIIFRKGIS